ncbi:MAG: histidinol-phosphate transaminase [Porticoccaceae bacterium]|nr:histidinol-phosphate transaminase [Porticoccaceae bacterium]MDG1474964.1 histidinol-phosphate transaminase [Porticoccaceae bacterium]
MSKYWSNLVRRLQPYTPGEQPRRSDITKLNTNENPFAPSPSVMAAIQAQLTDDLRLYPPPEADQLKNTIADYFSLRPEQVFLGNGSDEVLAHVFNGLLRKDLPLLFPDITYSFYPVFCQLYDIQFEKIPLTSDLCIDVKDYHRGNGAIIFPNPNAPTGDLLALDAIKALLQSNVDSVVVIDEAYIDFGGVSAVSLINDYPNLLVVQTMSKSRSLAGMRIGYALGSSELIEGLDRVKNSFNSYPLGHLQIAAGIAAFEDKAYFQQTCNQVIQSRTSLTGSLEEIGFEVLPSKGNFVFVRHQHYEAAIVAKKLRDKGIFVRHFDQERIREFLRISVGTEDQHQQLLDTLKNLINQHLMK